MPEALAQPPRAASRRWPWAVALFCLLALALVWVAQWQESQRLAAEQSRQDDSERRVVLDLATQALLHQLQRLDDALLVLRGDTRAGKEHLVEEIGLLRRGPWRELSASISVVGKEGQLLVSDPPSREAAYQGTQEHFLHFASGGGDALFVDGPVPQGLGDAKARGIRLSRPILDPQGRFAGVVALTLEARQLTAFARHVDLGKEGVLTLISPTGRVLSRSRDLEQHLGKQVPDHDLQHFRQNQHGLLRHVSPLDGSPRTAAFRWLDQYPLLVLVASSSRQESQAIALLQESSLNTGIQLSLLILMVGAAIAFHLHRRDRLETLLAQERSHFLEAQRVSRLGSWEQDMASNTLWWSEQTYRVLGLDPEKTPPSYPAFLATIHPDDRDRVDQAFLLCRSSGGELDISFRQETPERGERHLHVGGRGEKNPQDQSWHLTGTIQDVTDYLRLQQALQDAEERWKFALEGAGEGVWDWDVAGQHIYFSPRWKAIIGYDDSELPNRHSEWIDRLHPEDRSLVLTTLTDHLAGRSTTYAQEFRLQHKDGGYRWVLCRGCILSRDKVGHPLRMLGTICDISGRKEAELSLTQKEVMQRSLVSALAEGLVVQHQDGRVLLTNGAARRILQCSDEALVARGFPAPEWKMLRDDGSFLPPEHFPAQATLASGVSQDNVILGIDRPDGPRLWLSVNTRPLVHSSDSLPYAVVIAFTDLGSLRPAPSTPTTPSTPLLLEPSA